LYQRGRVASGVAWFAATANWRRDIQDLILSNLDIFIQNLSAEKRDNTADERDFRWENASTCRVVAPIRRV